MNSLRKLDLVQCHGGVKDTRGTVKLKNRKSTDNAIAKNEKDK